MRRDEILIDNGIAPNLDMFNMEELTEVVANVHGIECTALAVIFGITIAGCVVSLLGSGTLVMAVKRRNREIIKIEEMMADSKARAIMRDQRWEPMRGKRDRGSEDGTSRITIKGIEK